MKTAKLPLALILLLFVTFGCSDDGETSDNTDALNEEQIANLLLGDWTATSLGVIYTDDSEDSADDPCGAFQNIRFLNDGTWESDNYVLENEMCNFTGTWSGTYVEMENEIFPDANYELVITQEEGEEDLFRYPEITFDGEDTMRIQYLWTGLGDIAYTFTLYQRD